MYYKNTDTDGKCDLMLPVSQVREREREQTLQANKYYTAKSTTVSCPASETHQ